MGGRLFFKPHYSGKLLIAFLQIRLTTVPVTALGTVTAWLERATAFWDSKDLTVGEVSHNVFIDLHNGDTNGLANFYLLGT